MPNLFFNKLGYYITGDGIEIARSCPPLTFRDGDEPVLDPVHHLYAVLISALMDLKSYKIIEDITVFNDSRIIEEMQGEAPLDDTCAKSVRYLRQTLMPLVPTIVWFRKKAGDWVEAKIKGGHQRLIGMVDVGTRNRKAEEIAEHLEAKKRSRNRNRVEDFKRSWFGKSRD